MNVFVWYQRNQLILDKGPLNGLLLYHAEGDIIMFVKYTPAMLSDVITDLTQS